MTSFEVIPFFYFLLPLVAFLYASVGHGGASGYLALMILFAFPENEMKSTALVLNIFVSAIAFLNFVSKKHFDLKVFLFVGIISIPAAYYGGGIDVEDALFKKVLGVFLLIAILKLLGVFDRKSENDPLLRTPNLYLGLAVGLAIGFLSGLLGIGGGILLTPILIFLRWSTVKVAAGISALFIFVNSAAGLLGQFSADKFVGNENLPLLITLAVLGGLAGGYLGSRKFNSMGLRIILSAVLLMATYKLFSS
jgi:uncharacterized protein